jgi:hypothetical protein
MVTEAVSSQRRYDLYYQLYLFLISCLFGPMESRGPDPFQPDGSAGLISPVFPSGPLYDKKLDTENRYH